MAWIRDLKIFKKLLILISISALFLIAVGFIGSLNMNQMNANAEEMYRDCLLPVRWVNIVRTEFRAIEADIWHIMLTEDKATIQKLMDDIQTRGANVDKVLTEYEKTRLDPYEAERLPQVRQKLSAYRVDRQKAVEMALAGQRQEAYVYFTQKGLPQIAEITGLLRNLASYNSEKAEALAKDTAEHYMAGKMELLAVNVLAVVLMVLIGIYIARIIVRPVKELQHNMALAGTGNLTAFSKVTGLDEIGELSAAFNLMIRRQGEVVQKVRNSAVELAAASEEMAASSEQVTSTTDQIAKNIQHVAYEAEKGDKSVVEASQALLELSSLIQIAKSQGESAVENSKTTQSAAVEGQATVGGTVQSMERIRTRTADTEQLISTLSQYSEQIGVITDTITGLANQTNLLALNAAIEAARAGEAGRGFAVVAEEVRKLAEQSNNGAGEVAALVKKIAASTEAAVSAMRESRAEVEQGVTSVNRAGTALDKILAAVNSTVADIDSVVSVASEEVATSEKIISLINELSSTIEITDQNATDVAASTEETLAAMETVAASAEECSAMADDLKTTVQIFKLPSKTGLTTEETLERAKSDHLLWKMRVANMINGIENMALSDVTAHTDCSFGQWYFDPANPFRNEAVFKAIDEPHQGVHQFARQAVEAYLAGDTAKARSMLAQVEKNSTKVIKCFDKLIQKSK